MNKSEKKMFIKEKIISFTFENYKDFTKETQASFERCNLTDEN